MVNVLRDSLVSVLSWLSSFHASFSFSRGVKIICLHLAPFFSNCVRSLFPFEMVGRLFGTTISHQQYVGFYTEIIAVFIFRTRLLNLNQKSWLLLLTAQNISKRSFCLYYGRSHCQTSMWMPFLKKPISQKIQSTIAMQLLLLLWEIQMMRY